MNGKKLYERIAEAMADPHYCKCHHFASEHEGDQGKCLLPWCTCPKFTSEDA